MKYALMLLLSFIWLHCLACHIQSCTHFIDDSSIINSNGQNAETLFLQFQNLIDQSDFDKNPVDIVVIDPGHGGKDKGCSGPNSKEKTLTLDISKQLKSLINSQMPEIKVLLTRDSDKFVSLKKRADIANTNQADIFISIHCNYLRNAPKFRGSETYVLGSDLENEASEALALRENSSITLEDTYKSSYGGFDPYSPESFIMLSMFQNLYLDNSILLAQLIDDELVSATEVSSHGVKQGAFVVLKETKMPSILVETGYLSNEIDEKLLKSPSGQHTISQAILNAIRAYKYTID